MRIDHVAMYVEDLEAAKSFFTNYFFAAANECYHNKTTGFRSYFLSFPEGGRLEIMWRPDMVEITKALYRTGYSHLALSVGSQETVDHVTARLQQDGYTVLSGPRVTGDGYYESSILGFEGNIIEITV